MLTSSPTVGCYYIKIHGYSIENQVTDTYLSISIDVQVNAAEVWTFVFKGQLIFPFFVLFWQVKITDERRVDPGLCVPGFYFKSNRTYAGKSV